METMRMLVKTLGTAPGERSLIALWAVQSNGLAGFRYLMLKEILGERWITQPYDAIRLTPGCQNFSVFQTWTKRHRNYPRRFTLQVTSPFAPFPPGKPWRIHGRLHPHP